MKFILIFLVFVTQANPILPNRPLRSEQPFHIGSKTLDWKESLYRFKTALLMSDKSAVKSFFKFPIRDPGNDIWFVADTRYVKKIDSKTIVPFTELDFDTHYSAIFSIDFRKTLDKIDIERLATHFMTETAELKIVGSTTSKMRANYSQAKKSITLSLITTSPEFGKFTIDYHFRIMQSGDLEFLETTFII